MKIFNAFHLKDNKISRLESNGFYKNNTENKLFNVYPVVKDKFYGFGGAITEASAYNYFLLSNDDKQKFLESLVGDTGLKYRLFRLCISSSDFSLDSYDYIELNDESLNSFNINRDLKYIIPLIKDIIKYAKYEINFIASSWSPPAFMKDTNKRNYGGKLQEKYYELYSKYIIKFLKAYMDEGINIKYLTIQNEPLAIQTWESCYFTVYDEINFSKVLNENLVKKKMDINLLCWDHNKERMFERADKILSNTDFFKGVAFHWYSGDHFDSIEVVKKKYPSMLVFETEFCKSTAWDLTFGNYINEIINDIRKGANGIVEWNILLDSMGGPYHDRGDIRYAGCEAPLRLDKENNLIKGAYYNETWMFSNFIDYNSDILYTSSFNEKIKVSAVKNNDDSIVVSIYNCDKDCNGSIYIDEEFLDISLKESSLTTIIIKKDR